jgi:hypothetical protein
MLRVSRALEAREPPNLFFTCVRMHTRVCACGVSVECVGRVRAKLYPIKKVTQERQEDALKGKEMRHAVNPRTTVHWFGCTMNYEKGLSTHIYTKYEKAPSAYFVQPCSTQCTTLTSAPRISSITSTCGT